MIYLLSYSPLANTRSGRTVAARNGIPPYVDASCRREPDFELAAPFISGLCRPKFIGRLAVEDVMVYVSKTSAIRKEGRRLVAVLQLNRVFRSHSDAGAWYQTNHFRVPYSCIVSGNPPLPIHLTEPKMTRKKYADSKVWDRAVYVPRARACVQCFSCSALFLDLHDPPAIGDEFWIQWFGSDPGKRMQNGGLPLQQDVYDALLNHAGIHLN
jgi:hypothetical protein